MLEQLIYPRSGKSKRISSYDVSGANGDARRIEPGETFTLAEFKGAGIIRHIWFTVAHEDENYLRRMVLRFYWDGQEEPSVECPLGDFFGVGHARTSSYHSLVMSMSANKGDEQHAAMNCYFQMPFGDGAKVTVSNESEGACNAFYFMFDYDELKEAPSDLRFHALWRRENPTDGWMTQRAPQGSKEMIEAVTPAKNLTDKYNYLILEAEGRGHYVGTVCSIHNLYGGWWGEGDDMFMVDGEKWPPDLHGTGSEDYFNHAWGMQPHNHGLYNGVSYYKPGTFRSYNERITVYRWHINEPVIFNESLRVSIEHGHANNRCDDWSSVAYWYQTLPHKPFPPLLPVEQRLPRPDMDLLPRDQVGPAEIELDRRDLQAKS